MDPSERQDWMLMQRVGQGDEAGVWEDTPVPRPEFRKEVRRLADKAAKRRKAEEMGS